MNVSFRSVNNIIRTFVLKVNKKNSEEGDNMHGENKEYAEKVIKDILENNWEKEVERREEDGMQMCETDR